LVIYFGEWPFHQHLPRSNRRLNKRFDAAQFQGGTIVTSQPGHRPRDRLPGHGGPDLAQPGDSTPDGEARGVARPASAKL
jgi:hypothetical protein